MIVRQALQQFVLANPGTKLREIAAGIGMKDRDAITNASAQLHQLVKAGRLRREPTPGQFHGVRYFPTAATGKYGPRPTPEESAAKARAREERKKARNREHRRIAAEQRLAPRPAPHLSPKPVHVPLPPPGRCARPAQQVETVAEFIARGGRIQKLGPFENSNPLRFEHSRADSPLTHRRGAVSPRRQAAQ